MTKKPKKEGDVYHFISYVPFKGKLYELDGLQEGPILLGDCDEVNWVDAAREEINKRILKYATNEIRFSLLAIVSDKTEKYQQDLKKINNLRGHLYKKLKELGGTIEPELAADAEKLMSEASDIEEESQIPKGLDDVHARLTELSLQAHSLKDLLQDEQAKHKRYTDENTRRKHNYLPFIIEMLKLVAKKGKLKELVDTAKEKQQARAKAKEDKDKDKK